MEHDVASSVVSVEVGGHWFGLPIQTLREILAPQRLTPVPLAPPGIAGLLNLRGRVVTTVDVRALLGLPGREDGRGTNVVVAHDDEHYSLVVDKVGDVLDLAADRMEPPMATLQEIWRNVTKAVYRLDDKLLLLVDLGVLLDLLRRPAASQP